MEGEVRLILPTIAFCFALVDVSAVVAQPSDGHEQASPCVYLAGPLGFSEAGRYFVKDVLVPEMTRHGYQPIDPFSLTDPHKIEVVKSMPPGEARLKAWRDLNQEIGETNRAAIDRCELMIAVLDGPDVDSGTASEVGYGFARQKRVLGYRGDFRLASDDEGGEVNLQVEYFIRSSGGTIVTTVSELGDELTRRAKSKR